MRRRPVFVDRVQRRRHGFVASEGELAASDPLDGTDRPRVSTPIPDQGGVHAVGHRVAEGQLVRGDEQGPDDDR